MVALERINVRETVARKNNFKLNFFSMNFVRNNEEIHLSFENGEKERRQALKTENTKMFCLECISLSPKTVFFLVSFPFLSHFWGTKCRFQTFYLHSVKFGRV